MTSFYISNGRIRANHVDFERAAKLLVGVIGEMSGRAVAAGSAIKVDKSHSLDLLATILGATSYADVRSVANDPDTSYWTQSMLEDHVQKGARTSGESFPRLPPKFGKKWQEKVVRAFLSAFNAIKRGHPEFIALIGGEGSGKSVLAKNMVFEKGGFWIDASISNVRQATRPLKEGELLVLDVPTATYREARTRWGKPLSAEFSALSSVFQVAPSLEIYRKRRRQSFSLSYMDHYMNSRAEWVSKNHQATLVMCFPDLDSVREWMECNLVVGYHPTRNWRQAHVIDLDRMDAYTIEGRSLKDERELAEQES